MASGLSVYLPLQLDSDDGAFKLIKDFRTLIKQNLKMLILTSQGERIMDIGFGVGLKKYLFENMSPVVFDDIRTKINEQVNKYMPFVQIDDVKISSENETQISNYIHLELFYTILPLDLSDYLALEEHSNE